MSFIFNGGQPIGARYEQITITDAEYKALPTAGVDLVPALGAGWAYDFHWASLYAKFASGAYTLASTSLSFLEIRSGVGISSYIANDSAASIPLAYLTAFNDANNKRWKMLPWVDTSDAILQWGNLTAGSSTFTGDNQPLTLKMTNGGVNLGGGHVNNELRVAICYSIQKL